MRNRRLLIVVVCLGAILLVVVTALYLQLRSHESGAFADVAWKVGGIPGEVRVTVRDSTGNPVKGARVHVMNESGGSGGETDAAGEVRICPGEPEFGGLSLDGQMIVSRRYAYILGTPNVSQGMTVVVVTR